MAREWYVIRVQSGREEKVRNTLARKIQLAGLDERVTSILVPTENVTEIKGGRKRVRERKLYPGYVLVEMELNDEVWFVIRDTPGIGDFVGAYGRPVPMRPDEVSRILKGQQEKEEQPAPCAFHNPIQPASLAPAPQLTAGRRTARPARAACKPRALRPSPETGQAPTVTAGGKL